MKSTLWRDSRRRQEYRNLSRKFDAGLYALAQLSAREDNEIDIGVNSARVRQDLQRCIGLLKHLRKVAEDPAYGAIEEVNLVDSEDVTVEQLTEVITKLTRASISLSPPDNSVRQFLTELEHYTSRKAEQHSRF